VGAYTNSGSHYGTFDQGGNVEEWNDAIVGPSRVVRGASFFDLDFLTLKSVERRFNSPSSETDTMGFRVSNLAPIPEPSAYAAILGCLGLALALTRRKGRGTPLKF